MSRSANPVAIGLFTLITIALAILLVMLFGGSDWWSPKERYVLLYDSSIRGLNVGSPVTLKGVTIGQVTDTRVTLYGETSDILNTVTIEIDPSALKYQGRDDKGVSVDDLLKRGLRAQLRQQSLLTGLLYVDVDFDPGKPAAYKPVKTDFPQLPTTPTNLEQLSRDLESVDVNRLANDLQQALSGISQLLNDPAMQQLAGNLGNAVKALEDTANRLGMVGDQLGQQAAEQRQPRYAGAGDQTRRHPGCPAPERRQHGPLCRQRGISGVRRFPCALSPEQCGQEYQRRRRPVTGAVQSAGKTARSTALWQA